jgi:type IV secretion system protein VirB1
MDFNVLASECAPWVAPQTMAAIVRTESQFKPFAININGKAKLERQPATKEEAVITAKWLIENKYNIDLGLGQVNSVNLAKTNLSVEDAFDPCKNIAAAATILKWNYESASKKIPDEQAALQAAISAYNTGSFTRGFNNGYVQKVVSNANIKTQAVSPISLKTIAAGTANLPNNPKHAVEAKSENGVIDAEKPTIENASVGASNIQTPHMDPAQDVMSQDVMIFK